MSINIVRIDNSCPSSQSVVIIGEAPANFADGALTNGSIVYGNSNHELSEPLTVPLHTTPDQPVLYVATTTSIGYMQLHENGGNYEVRYKWNAYGQGNDRAGSGTANYPVTNGNNYEINVVNGSVTDLQEVTG